MRVELIRAWLQRHESMSVELADGATIGDALVAARWALDAEFTSLAVFGQTATVSMPLHGGERVELLRGLQMDPKQARRLRADRRKQV